MPNSPHLRLIVGGAVVREVKPVMVSGFCVESVEVTDDDDVEVFVLDSHGNNGAILVISSAELRERYAKALAKRQIIGGPPDAAA